MNPHIALSSIPDLAEASKRFVPFAIRDLLGGGWGFMGAHPSAVTSLKRRTKVRRQPSY